MLLKRIRHCFNMIEITLAIAIMGVGITSLMALLPVGLRSSQESVANNYVPIIADYFYGLIRTDLMFNRTSKTIKLPGVKLEEDSEDDSKGVKYYEYEKLNDPKSAINGFEEKTELDKLLEKTDNKTILSIKDDGEIDGFTWNIWDKAGSDNKLKIDTDGDDTLSGITNQPVNIFFNKSGSYKNDYVVVFRSKSETGNGLTYNIVDFAAEVRLFKDDSLEIDGKTYTNGEDFTRVYMHISWPIELPLSKRQSRVYAWDVARGVFE